MLMVAVSGCVGGIVNQSSRPALSWLEQPSADMIQTDTEPPYGAVHTQVPPGGVVPVSTDAAEEKGLASNGHLNRDYALVQNMYRAILLPRLVDTLGLAVYDQELASDGIVAASGDNVPFSLYAQQCAGLKLDYLYVRNNLYVERLTKDQIDMFLAHANDPGFVTNPDLDQIVTDTFSRVFRLYDFGGDVQVGFDGSFRFYNDAVVVYLTTSISADEMTPDGMDDTPLHYERTALLNGVMDRLNQTLPQHWPGHIGLWWTYAGMAK